MSAIAAAAEISSYSTDEDEEEDDHEEEDGGGAENIFSNEAESEDDGNAADDWKRVFPGRNVFDEFPVCSGMEGLNPSVEIPNDIEESIEFFRINFLHKN